MSAPTPECLDNIIGLSQTDCNCFPNDTTIDGLTSKSGIYLDQLEGLNIDLLDSASDCDQGSVWDLMERARNNATKTFKADLLTGLLTHNKERRLPFLGIIGQSKFTRSLSLTSTYAGLRVYCNQIMGGTMTIKRIGLSFNQAQTFDISVYNAITDTVVETYTVTSVANQVTYYDLPTPLVLEMNNTESDAPEYYFIYELAGGLQPKDNSRSCGCGGSYKPVFNTDKPTYMKPGSYNKDRWNEFVMVAGISGNDITERDDWNTSSAMNGILLDVEFKCKITELICQDDMDFENNPMAAVMAFAIRYKAGVYLADSILASGKINRYTTMDRERLMGKKNSYEKEYQSRIEWLSQAISPKINDCLVCRDENAIFKGGIFA
jgi:hypothetical protein